MRDDELDAAQLRKLSAKCRRLASNGFDAITVAALRKMATEFEAMANKENGFSRPQPPSIISF